MQELAEAAIEGRFAASEVDLLAAGLAQMTQQTVLARKIEGALDIGESREAELAVVITRFVQMIVDADRSFDGHDGATPFHGCASAPPTGASDEAIRWRLLLLKGRAGAARDD